MTFEKLFTLPEAQAMIPLVIPQLEELVELKQDLDRRGYDVLRHQYFGGMGPNGQKVFPTQMERLVVIVQALNEAGIEVKDVEKGLIDFPYRRHNGEVVYLCFRLGEQAITSWHTIQGGFSGRQPLSTL